MKTGASWDEAVDYFVWLAKHGDENGYHDLSMIEHHFREDAAGGSPAMVLTYIAAVTSRIRLSTSVLLLPFHHPVRLAEQLLLVDRLSGGRLDVGVRRGHAPIESTVLCAHPDRSVDMFNDAFEVIRPAFRREPFAFDGTCWRFPEIQIFPPPVQRIGADGGAAPGSVPLFMPITSPRSIEFAVKNEIIHLLG